MTLKRGTRSFYIVGFLLLMIFDTIAQLCFKYTAMSALPLQVNADWLLRILFHPWIYGAVFGYIGAFLTWMTLLKKAPIGPAFAASHLDVISVMLCSYWLLNEHLSWIQLVGAVVILVGIVCLAFGEKTSSIK
ncbi:MAG: EamA family transporter [Gammaproteobacteria bacterium]|nr:EamA family transporter [Gammaproteobacteria bacterium]